MNVLGRRALLQGSVPVALGAAALAAPARAADVGPDAELIRLCGVFIAEQRRWREIYVTFVDDEAALAAVRPVWDDLTLQARRICQLRAVTAEGTLARLQALHEDNPDLAHSFDYPDEVPGMLLDALLRDAAAMPYVAVVVA